MPRPFGKTLLRYFVSNSTQRIQWPGILDEYPCGGWTCPSAGLDGIGQWTTGLQFDGASPQIPFTNGGDNFYRWLISNSTDYGGWTVTTSPMMTLGTYLGSYWNWISTQGLAPTVSLRQPQLGMSFADTGYSLQPLVQVQCSAYTSNTTLSEDFLLPNDQLEGLEISRSLRWPVPQNYTRISADDLLEYPMNMYWARLPLNNYANSPTAALIFVLPDDFHTRTVIPCSILAHWAPGALSILPKTDRNTHVAVSNPLDLMAMSVDNLSMSNQIQFSDGWWSQFLGDTSPSSLDTAMYGLTQGPCTGCLDSYSGGTQGLAYRISSVIGVFITDAISRYVVTTQAVVVQQPNNGGESFAQNLGGFEAPHVAAPYGYNSWLEYAENNTDVWREIIVTVKRYGYGWSFDSVLVIFASVALLIHTVLAVGHVAVMFSGRWTSNAWDTIASMLAMALRSQRPAVPADSGTGHEKKGTWAETVSVRLVGTDLELHFGLPRAETLRMLRR